MEKLLILGAGVIQIPVILRAKELGAYTIVLDYNKKAPGAKYADVFLEISTNDTDKVLKVAQEYKINGILTTSDYPVNVVAQVAKTLGLPAMSVYLAKLCTNKYMQREFLHEHNIAVPKFVKIQSEDEISLVNFFPCVIKPVDSSASRGVKMVSNPEELIRQYHISKNLSISGTVIVEEFISGREFSVETFTQDKETKIIQITEKLIIGEENGYFVEDTHIVPARITEEEKNNIENTIYDVLEKMGVTNTPTHTEIKLNANRVFIIEIACRLGGDYITSDLVPLSTGIDMLENLIFLSLNKPINIEKTKEEVASVQFLNPQNYHRCINFINSQNSYIVRSEVYPYAENKIKNSNDRLGFIILNTPDMTTMKKLLAKIK